MMVFVYNLLKSKYNLAFAEHFLLPEDFNLGEETPGNF